MAQASPAPASRIAARTVPKARMAAPDVRRVFSEQTQKLIRTPAQRSLSSRCQSRVAAAS